MRAFRPTSFSRGTHWLGERVLIASCVPFCCVALRRAPSDRGHSYLTRSFLLFSCRNLRNIPELTYPILWQDLVSLVPFIVGVIHARMYIFLHTKAPHMGVWIEPTALWPFVTPLATSAIYRVAPKRLRSAQLDRRICSLRGQMCGCL